MAINFTLIINAVDFSEYIQQETDIKETMTRVVGPAQADAVDGTTIPDLVKVKWNPSFLLKPMPRSMMATLIQMMEEETVELEYTSIKHGDPTLRQITAIPVSLSVQYATTFQGERIYADTPISFEEV